MGVDVEISGPQVCESRVKVAPAPAPMLNAYKATISKSQRSSCEEVEMFATNSEMSAKTWATMPPPTEGVREWLKRVSELSVSGKATSIPTLAKRRRVAVNVTPAPSIVTGRSSKRPPGL